MSRSLILDANNLLYRIFFAQLNESSDIAIGMCYHGALWTLRKYFNAYPADDVVMAFDSLSWRKLYTSDLNECVTHKKYKGTRRQNLTPAQKERLQSFDEHVTEFAEMLKNETSVLVLRQKYLEADDLISGYIQMHPGMEHVLVSSDKDYMQLLERNNLTIVDPDSGNPRSLADWNNDPNFFMFEKCLRGDTSDNVMSAYPRLRSKVIKEAFNDEYVKQNVMNHEFKVLVNSKDGSVEEKSYITKDIFDENNFLMNLYEQPDNIKTLMLNSINKSIANRSRFNYVKFMRFCGRHQLTNILDSIDQFVPVLSVNPKL